MSVSSSQAETARCTQRVHRDPPTQSAIAHTSVLHNGRLVAHLRQHCVHRRYQEPLRDSNQDSRACNGGCVAGGPRREQGSSGPEGKGHHQHQAAAIALGCRAPRDLQATASSHGHEAWRRAMGVISTGWLHRCQTSAASAAIADLQLDTGQRPHQHAADGLSRQ